MQLEEGEIIEKEYEKILGNKDPSELHPIDAFSSGWKSSRLNLTNNMINFLENRIRLCAFSDCLVCSERKYIIKMLEEDKNR